MKTSEREKLCNIVDELWQLHQETGDVVAQKEIRLARAKLLVLWDESDEDRSDSERRS